MCKYIEKNVQIIDFNNKILEQTKEGLKIYENPIGVLTNNPEFSFHLTNINNYILILLQMFLKTDFQMK